MQPSISVTLEPGLERGVPWGRDLYTFVTSAASHMMRTLQKPRKNRPSKRQVNHRRFLHNMIQRKFADIEAANHRLASALYFKEEEKNISSQPSQKPETADQSGRPTQGGCLQDPDKCAHTGADDVSSGSHEAEATELKKQPDSEHLWKRQPKSQPATCTTRKHNQTKGSEKKDHKLSEFKSMTSPKVLDYCHGAELFDAEYYADESPLKSNDNLSEDSQTTLLDSGFVQLGQDVDISPFFSPELSLLSLDSCDFSIQMFTDVPACAQAQRNATDISESQWTDIMDLFSVGSKDSGGCADVETCFESICLCQEDAGQEAGDADVGFADQSDGFTERTRGSRSQVDDLLSETGEYRYEYGYSCDGDQGLTINHFQSQVKDSAETQLNSFKPSRGPDITHSQPHTPVSYPCNASELQTYQHPKGVSPCMLFYCENNQNFTPFEGVAQSFSVPHHNPVQRPIPTLPQEDDWLFTILKDRRSPDC